MPIVNYNTELTPTMHPAYINPEKTHLVANLCEVFFQELIFCSFYARQLIIAAKIAKMKGIITNAHPKLKLRMN